MEVVSTLNVGDIASSFGKTHWLQGMVNLVEDFFNQGCKMVSKQKSEKLVIESTIFRCRSGQIYLN